MADFCNRLEYFSNLAGCKVLRDTLVIKHTTDTDITKEPPAGDSFIPIDLDKVETSPMIEFLQEKHLTQKNTNLKSQRPNLNNYYDEINELNNSKYNEKYPQHYSTPVKITRVYSSNHSTRQPDLRYARVARPAADTTTSKPVNETNIYDSVPPSSKPQPVASRVTADNNSSVAYTISNSPFRTRGIVKIKTNNNLKSSFQTQNLKAEDTSATRQIPIETVSSYRQAPKEQTERFLSNRHLTVHPGLSQVRTAEIRSQNEETNRAESVAEFLTKSKVFTAASGDNSILYDASLGAADKGREESEQARTQRRSSRIGEEQNEKELNSIFRRIYNRHRFSIGSGENGQMKPVGIRRFSNTNNLSSF